MSVPAQTVDVRNAPWPSEPDAPAATPVPAAPSAAPKPVAPAAPRAGLPIGTLRHVDPVELWRSEDFAIWLGQHLDEIGTRLDLALTLKTGEAPPPATVIAVDPEGNPVRIVVELGASSDRTFGLLMRQIVASGAKTAIWVCARARDEHLDSVRWLNREIAGHVHVVGVEAVAIDDSAPAPVFQVALRADNA
ncbi:MAG: hypothetical protein ABI534_02975 [Chloroflexota bacterium]